MLAAAIKGAMFEAALAPVVAGGFVKALAPKVTNRAVTIGKVLAACDSPRRTCSKQKFPGTRTKILDLCQ